jgi:uncharacterized repeat protein (TIGR02543 family)
MIRVFLDNVEISNNVEIDLSYVEKLNMELDEGFIMITHTNRAEPFPMYGLIDIYEDNTIIFSGRIAQDNVEITSFSDQHYNHKVVLTEHTKILEKYFVTGKSFTQPIEDVGVNPYTLYDVVEILRTTTKLEISGRETFNTPFIIPNSVKEELEVIIAPEFNFKDVTLREALNEVLSYLDAIVRIDRNSNIIIEKFNEIKNQINFVTENYRKNQDISNYATMIASEVNNPVNTDYGLNENNTEYYPGKNLWTSLRSEVLGQFNFDTSFIPTHKPIYDVKNVFTSIVLVVQREDLNTTVVTEVVNDTNFPLNITDNVVERATFNFLEDKDPEDRAEITKRNSIVYDYAKKGIFVGQTYGLFDVDTVFPFLLESSIHRQLKESGIIEQDAVEIGVGSPGNFSYLYQGPNGEEISYVVNWLFNGSMRDSISFKRWRGLFRVEYVPIPPSIRYEVARDDTSEVFVESKIAVNQKMRIVDLERFTANMKGKINQLGTSELILSHKVKNISETFNIGDFTPDRFVITKKEVITQRDHYIVNYELSKNFNKISQFMGIDQEIRQYEIGESGRTIDRDLNYNEYIEVFADDSATLTPGTTTLQDVGVFLDTLNNSFNADKDLKYGLFTSPQVVDQSSGTSTKINLPIYKISGGGAFGLYSDFETNVGASNRLETGDGSFLGFEDNRRYVFPVPYANQIGRFDTMFISYYNDVLADETGSNSIEAITNEQEVASDIPLFRKQEGTPIIEGEFFVKKDNRERIKFTLLYHLISRDINEVVIGEKIYTHNSLFIDEANTVILKKFNNKTFTKRDFNSPITGEDEKITNPNITINKSNMYIQIEDDLSGVSSWALVDENNLPYLIVNSSKRRVLFDFKSKRDDISEPGIPEPTRLLRAELESSVAVTSSLTNTSTISFIIGNPNDEEVNGVGVLSGETEEISILRNASSTPFVFGNLEPNLDYTGTFTLEPLPGSDSISSFSRTFSRRTPIPNAFAPTFEIQSFQIFSNPLDIPGFGEVNIYSVDLLVNNPNNYPATVLTLVNGLNVTNLQFSSTINKIIPANGSDVITITTIDPGDGQTIQPPGSNTLLTDIMDPFMFALETYTFRIRLRSSGFINNWVTPLSDIKSLFIDLDPTAKPDVTWVPSPVTGRLRFNIKNNDVLPVTFTQSTFIRRNGNVTNVQEITDLVSNGTTIQPGLTIEFTADGIQGNEEDVFQLQVEVKASGQNVSPKETANGRLAGKAKRPAIISINSTSTNAASFINFQLVNRERYTAKIYYATNTFSSNFTPNQTFVELAPGATSNTLTYTVPSNNQGDLHYIHALTEAISPNTGFEEIQSDSDVRVSPAIQPAALITQLTVRFLDFSDNVIRTVLVDQNGFLQQSDFPTIPTQTGYTSSFWVNVDTNTSVGTNTQITQNIDVSRNWTIITYNITYNLNGATNDAANPSTYTVEDSITFQDASRLGYDFIGWYLEPGFGTEITSIVAGSIGNLILYAKLEQITLQNIVFTTQSTLTSITVTATNPSANPRLSTNGEDTGVTFGLRRVSDNSIVSSLVNYFFSGPQSDEITVVYSNLTNATDFEIFGNGTNSAIRTFTQSGEFVESQQSVIPVSTVTPVGDKSLRVRLDVFGTHSASVTWLKNGVSQGSVTINSSGFTTFSSTLFDTDSITLNAPINTTAGTFQDFVVNGVAQNSISQSITLQVSNGLDVGIVYA